MHSTDDTRFDYDNQRPALLGRARGEPGDDADERLPALALAASVEVPGELGSAKVQIFGTPGCGHRSGVVLRLTVASEAADEPLVPHAELRADGVDLHLVTTWEAANILQALAEALRIAAERARAQKSTAIHHAAVLAGSAQRNG